MIINYDCISCSMCLEISYVSVHSMGNSSFACWYIFQYMYICFSVTACDGDSIEFHIWHFRLQLMICSMFWSRIVIIIPTYLVIDISRTVHFSRPYDSVFPIDFHSKGKYPAANTGKPLNGEVYNSVIYQLVSGIKTRSTKKFLMTRCNIPNNMLYPIL